MISRLGSSGLYQLLLAFTLAMVVLMALPAPFGHLRSFTYLLLTLLLALAMPRAHRAYRLLGVGSAAAQLLWLAGHHHNAFSGLMVLITATMFIGLSLHRLILCLAAEPRMNGPVVAGATAGYLLLGITGGLVLTVLDLLLPGTFRDSITGAGVSLPPLVSLVEPNPVWDQNFQRINYFAFVSLTTVGYGDITPSHPLVQLASVALSVLGPLYISVVLGVLISRVDNLTPPPLQRRRRFRAPARRGPGPGG